MTGQIFDIAIIGGGINGCGIARDAAGRGQSVVLFEKGDLGSGTSSAATKLIHGGLRYLEKYEFGLVRESLKEREVLLQMAPHIIWPLRFIFPHQKGLRPAWLIHLGLMIYDYLGPRKMLARSKSVNLRENPAGNYLHDNFIKGFEYSDCWVDDARLVILNAIDAEAKGAHIQPQTKVLSAKQEREIWIIRGKHSITKKEKFVKARALINASGPWAGHTLKKNIITSSESRLRLIRGSHIVVKKLFDHDYAYIFQNTDGRIIFSIPYEKHFTLIGTTDKEHFGIPEDVAITQEEIDYLCRSAGKYFKKPIQPNDVVWTFSGIRPLFDSGDKIPQKLTRDYVLTLENKNNTPPLLNVFGGKITTYRCLAEDALDKLSGPLGGLGKKWTRGASLPGGDFPQDQFNLLLENLIKEFSFLNSHDIHRMARAYGTRIYEMMDGASKIEDMGIAFGAGLYSKEVEYLIKSEWVTNVEDIIWRRSKLGLHMKKEEVEKLTAWMKN